MRHIHVVDVHGLTLLRSFQSDGRISGMKKQSVKRLRTEAIAFSANQPALGGLAPEVGPAGLKELTGETAETLNYAAAIAAFGGGAGEFEQEFLKRLVRMRRSPRCQCRVSRVGCQATPSSI
jgi:hypothetical protein